MNFPKPTLPPVGHAGQNRQVAAQIFQWQHMDYRTNVLENIYERSNDELWIETWLQQNTIYQPIPKIRIQKNVNDLSISDTQQTLKECLVLLEKLSKIQKELEDNVATMSSTNWKKKTIEIGVVKDEFTKLMGKFENPEVLKRLKAKIHKRKKKRLNIKKRKERRSEELNEMLEKKTKMHKDIDEWLRGMKEEAEKIKMEENMKRDADCVLSEVTKKKSDARKHLSITTALIKLRNAREQAALQRGEKISAEDRHAFNVSTEKLLRMWENSLKTYAVEEHGLKLMLEKNASEDSRAARVAKERKFIEDWHSVLFGPKHLTPVDNPTYWALTAAERDMETFIAIRKSWDTFLVPPSNEMGSKIPIGWVLPDQDASESWTKFLEV